MNDPVQDVISLLTKYWNGSGTLDARTKNYCQRLAETVLKELSVPVAESIIHEPQQYVGELARVLDQLFRTDPNSRQLINVLLVSINSTPAKSQSVNVSGNNNQVINVGGNMVAGPITQNNTGVLPEGMISKISQVKTTNSPSSAQEAGKTGYENFVFVSYAWGGESERMVDELEQALVQRGIRMVRDKKDLGYKGSIESFEQRIGRGKCVVLVISEKYLRSEHCMYELVQVNENQSLRERIFPIVLADARISRPLDRLTYIKYWDGKIEQLNRAIKEIGVMTNLANITADLDKYARIRSNFDHLTDLLSDMNTLTPELHVAQDFSSLISTIEQSMAKE